MIEFLLLFLRSLFAGCQSHSGLVLENLALGLRGRIPWSKESSARFAANVWATSLSSMRDTYATFSPIIELIIMKIGRTGPSTRIVRSPDPSNRQTRATSSHGRGWADGITVTLVRRQPEPGFPFPRSGSQCRTPACRACIHSAVRQPSQTRAPALISLPTYTRFPPVLQIVRSTHKFGPAMEFSLPTTNPRVSWKGC